MCAVFTRRYLGRVLILIDLMGPNGTRLFMIVPFLGKLRVWVHVEYWSSPAKSVRTVTFCKCHDTTAACWSVVRVHLHLRWRPSPSSETFLCPFGRAIRSSSRKGVRDILYLLLCSRAAWNLFDFNNQSVPTQMANNIPVGQLKVLMLFGGG